MFELLTRWDEFNRYVKFWEREGEDVTGFKAERDRMANEIAEMMNEEMRVNNV